jgi:hypothetical protein
MRANVFALAAALPLCAGCAASLQTFDSASQPTVGIPVSTPVLVKITEMTTYQPAPSGSAYAAYCTEEINSTFQFLALGERSFISFKPAQLGKAEFKLEFSDSGVLKGVSLNSDATAGVEQVAGFLETVLPYVASTKAMPDVKAGDAGDTSQSLKDKYCLKKGKEILSIERLTMS